MGGGYRRGPCGGLRLRARVLVLTLGFSFSILVLHGMGADPESKTSMTAARSSFQEPPVVFSRLPQSFERNQGQTDAQVKFLARGAGYTLFLTRQAAVLKLLSAAGSGKSARGAEAVVRVKWMGANPVVQVGGEEELAGRSNYFLGQDARRWHSDIPTYGKVRYRQVYRGVDLVYYGRRGELENDFEVGAGGDAGQIRMRVEGGSKVRVDERGEVVVEVGKGEVRLRRPQAYQERGTEREWVEARYVQWGPKEIGLAVGRYDRGRKLIIDPVLSYSTYLGGTGGDVAYGIAVDSSGNAYVTGKTASVAFPTTSAVQDTLAGSADAFVAKLNSTGSALVYSTYLGGNDWDSGNAIAIDSAGNAYVVGSTSSSNFPTTANPIQSTYLGNGDAFLAKLDPTGSALVYSTYLGGSNADTAQGVAVDSDGNAFVTGSTESTDFPTAAPLQIGNDGSSDAFVAKVNPSGTALIYSTYLGGSGGDYGRAIALDASGNAYITGYTFSKDFPTQNALQSSSAGQADAFVTQLNAAGSALLFSTYLGGSGIDRAWSIALDAAGSIYITGDTQSLNFPSTLNAYQANNKGQGDAFVTKFSSGGSAVVYSTLLGGGGTEQATALAVDWLGKVYITGYTQSADFPTLDPLQTILGISGATSCGTGICSDAFVARLGPSGGLEYSTFLGGSGSDFGQAIAVDSSGAAYVAGGTTSPNFPTISGAPQGALAGNSAFSNAFVAKVGPEDAPGAALTPQQINFGNQALNSSSSPQAVTLVNAGSASLEIASLVASGDFTQTNDCGTTLPAGGSHCTIRITFAPTTTGFRTDQITINDNATGSPHSITVTGNGVVAGGSLTLSVNSLTFPAGTVGTTSLPQSVRLTNTGNTAVTLSAISISGDFTQTNTCGNLPSVLNVGASCNFSITFSPTASGARTGTLSITDDAAGSPHGVSLAGTGNPVFTLSANPRSVVVVIGTTSTTFTVTASAPSSFTDGITVACASGVTCSFDSSSIYAGQSATLTVTGLSVNNPNPLNLTVNGTSGKQTASVTLAIFFSDFTVAASPPLNSVTAGQSATYSVSIAPIHGFNQVVLLSCTSVPQDTTCTWSPPGMTLDGTNTAVSTVTVTTTAQTTTARHYLPFQRLIRPPTARTATGAVGLAVLVLAFLMAWGVSRHRRGEFATRLRKCVVLATLAVILGIVSLGGSCNDTYYQNPATPAPIKGTPTGVYTIAITGTLGTSSTIKRATTVNLAVAPN